MHATTTLTNRVRRAQILGRGSTPIIDTIKVRGPVLDASSDQDTHRSRVDERTGEVQQRHVRGCSWLTFGSGEVVRLTVERGLASMEFSAPRVAWGHNVEAATIGQTWEIVDQAYLLARDYVEWACPVEHLSISRVDLPCDFLGVPEPGPLLDALSRTRPKRMTTTTGWATAYGTETLARNVRGRWRVSLYDKHAEYVNAHRQPDPAVGEMARGRLRFEPQLRRRALTAHKVRTMSDLSEEVAVGIAGWCFERAQFHVPVGVDTSLRALYDRYPGPIKELSAILMMLTWRELGLPDGLSRETRRKYQRLADEHGIPEAPRGAAAHTPVRLDFATRRLVQV